MRIEWDVPIPMDDGVVLRADVFRPIDAGRHPVVLASGPYGKGRHFRDGFPDQWERLVTEHPDVLQGSSGKYHSWEHCDPEKWVPHGYVCVRVDSRGSGRSPGFFCPFQARETTDLYECIEWAGRQPWSNGRVGLSGISYLGMNQWHVASMDPPPPSLAAMIPWEAAADWYRDATYHGGIRSLFWDGWYPRTLRLQHGMGDRGPVNPNTGEPVAGPTALSDAELEQNRCPFVDMMRAHRMVDEFHMERSPDWSKVTVPFLSAGNWGGQGLHLRGNTEAFTRAASQRKWLEMHGLEHWTHYYTDYGVSLQREFFDHFLKGEDNRWADRPPVLLQVRTIDGFVPRPEAYWPLARTEWTKLHLDPSDLTLSWDRPAARSRASYEGMGDGITFLSPPFDQPTEVTGPIAARLHIESSTVDADLFLVVRLIDPEGREVVFQGHAEPHTPIGQGWLRASHRKLDPDLTEPHRPYHTHDERQPLEPGEVYAVDVEIWPTSIVIPPDHRLALNVRPSDNEFTGLEEQGVQVLRSYGHQFRGSGPFLHQDPADRPADVFGGRVTVHGGADLDAFLLLPIVPEAHGTAAEPSPS